MVVSVGVLLLVLVALVVPMFGIAVYSSLWNPTVPPDSEPRCAPPENSQEI